MEWATAGGCPWLFGGADANMYCGCVFELLWWHLQTWAHAKRRVLQLEREKEAVLAQGRLQGIALDPDETYTRVHASA